MKYKLEEHINGTHLGLKPYKCELCGFCTAYRNVHNEHKKVAHGNQRYDCPYCQHTARYKGNLTKHLRSVHKRDKWLKFDTKAIFLFSGRDDEIGNLQSITKPWWNCPSKRKLKLE